MGRNGVLVKLKDFGVVDFELTRGYVFHGKPEIIYKLPLNTLHQIVLHLG